MARPAPTANGIVVRAQAKWVRLSARTSRISSVVAT